MVLAHRGIFQHLTSPGIRGHFQYQERRQTPVTSNPPNTHSSITQPTTPVSVSTTSRLIQSNFFGKRREKSRFTEV